MTIASALTALNTDIQNARTAIATKGGTVTSGGGSSQLATDIATIPSGGGGGGIGIPREAKNGVYQMPTENFTFSLPNDVTDVGAYAFSYAFYNCTALTSIDLSLLTTVTGSNGFAYALTGCTALTSIDLSSLTTVTGNSAFSYAFYNCTALTSIDLSSLTTVSGGNGLFSAFRGCTALTSIDLSSLTTVTGSNGFAFAFQNCARLTDIYFRALTTSSFGSNKSQFNNMMNGTGSTVTHTIHFPSNMESTISGLSGYPLFSGTSGYVVLAYDLPATS